VCLANVRRRYQQRLSGPLLDRVDVRVDVEPVAHADLLDARPARETSASVAARVGAARAAAAERWAGTSWRTNADVPGSVLRSGRWALPGRTARRLETFLQRGELTARGFDRVLRLAWTVADLGGRTVPAAQDLDEALFFRTGRGETWAA
jgi:magnesium chelatase family protein